MKFNEKEMSNDKMQVFIPKSDLFKYIEEHSKKLNIDDSQLFKIEELLSISIVDDKNNVSKEEKLIISKVMSGLSKFDSSKGDFNSYIGNVLYSVENQLKLNNSNFNALNIGSNETLINRVGNKGTVSAIDGTEDKKEFDKNKDFLVTVHPDGNIAYLKGVGTDTVDSSDIELKTMCNLYLSKIVSTDGVSVVIERIARRIINNNINNDKLCSSSWLVNNILIAIEKAYSKVSGATTDNIIYEITLSILSEDLTPTTLNSEVKIELTVDSMAEVLGAIIPPSMLTLEKGDTIAEKVKSLVRRELSGK